MSWNAVTLACLIMGKLVTGTIAQDLPDTQEQLSKNDQLVNAEAAWKGIKPVEQCAWCHYQSGNSFTARPTDFCQLNEARHWLAQDPHVTSRLRIEPKLSSDKRAAPSNVLSRRILDKLGYQVDTPSGYERFCNDCLTCHAGYRVQSQQPFQNQREGHPGLSCVYCHQTGDQATWIDLHGAASAATTWRLLTPETKQSHGLRHLASAQAQAELCYQCHIGDLSQNMFVSHAMFSAGHPPLPSVELQSLTRTMSPHWRSPLELYRSMSPQPQDRDAYFATHLSAPAQNQSAPTTPAQWSWQAQATALGAMQAQLQCLTLMEQSTLASYQRYWADYALYDCAGCHHALQSGSWRQKHRRETPPGRPLPIQWPVVLEKAVTHRQARSLNDVRERYLKTVTAVPFGNRKEVGQAAGEYRRALEEIQTALAKEALRPVNSKLFLEQLAQTPPQAILDFESARQLHVGAMNISQELGLPTVGIPAADKATYNPGAFEKQLQEWRAWLE